MNAVVVGHCHQRHSWNSIQPKRNLFLISILSSMLRHEFLPEELAFIYEALFAKTSPTTSYRAPKPSQSCRVEGCTRTLRSRGLCRRHGGGKICQVCDSLARASSNYCAAHGGLQQCASEGCDNLAQSKGLCRRHGGGRLCRVPTCQKGAQLGGLCRLHGGLKICSKKDCGKVCQRGTLCVLHSQTQHCKHQGCDAISRGGGSYCAAHRPTCQVPECTRFGKLNGLCVKHLAGASSPVLF